MTFPLSIQTRLRVGARFAITAILLTVGIGSSSTATAQASPRGQVDMSGADGANITFTGSGFGHGLGMSQYGAYGRAVAGQDVATILAAYYQGANLAIVGQGNLRLNLGDIDGGTGVLINPEPGRTTTMIVSNSDSPGGFEAIAAPDQLRITNDGTNFNFYGGGGLMPLTPATSPANKPLRIAFANDPVSVKLNVTNNRYLFGAFELQGIEGNAIRTLNVELPMQQYLYGLGEMPSSWASEALRAQAIAARTYAYDKVVRAGNNRSGCDCTLYSSTNDQVYSGAEKLLAPSAAAWQSAVDTTNDTVLMSGGAPVQAYYASSNGGFSDNSEEVFSAYLPYLRATPDPYDSYANPNATWSRRYSISDLSRYFAAYADTNVGTVTAVDIIAPLTGGGRVTRVDGARGGARISGSSGVKRVSGDRLKAVINAGARGDGLGTNRQLLSTRFQTGSIQYGTGFDAYDPAFGGGVSVASGNVLGDGAPEIVTAAGPTGGPHIRIFSLDGALIAQFFAYDGKFSGGVNVALGDVDGDGYKEIITSPMAGGGPHIQVFKPNGTLMKSFMAYDPGWYGGVYVASGDVNGDGRDDIITGAGAGGGPDVRAFNYNDLSFATNPFYAYDSGFHGGVRVAAGNFVFDGRAEIVTGAGPGGGPHVRVFGGDASLLGQFFAYRPIDTGGVFVAAGDMAGDGYAEVITAPGNGSWPVIRVWSMGGALMAPEFLGQDLVNFNGAHVAYVPAPQKGIVVGSRIGHRPTVSYFSA